MACDDLRQHAWYYIEVQYPDDRGHVTYGIVRYLGTSWGRWPDADQDEYVGEREIFATEDGERMELLHEWLLHCRFLRA